MKALLTVGISGSGKSTFAKKAKKDWQDKGRDVRILERDKIRDHMFVDKYGKPFLWSEWKWEWEKDVTDAFYKNLKTYSLLGADVIIADTNLNKSRRDDLIDYLTAIGYEDVEVVYIDEMLETCLLRDCERRNSVSESVIMKQYQQLHNDPNYPDNTIEEQKELQNSSLPACVIFDIDGTLAHMNGRGPFDYHKVETDTLDEEVATLLKYHYYIDNSTKVIIFSGRDDVSRELTESWLYDNGIQYDEFYMRDQNDSRKDFLVKEEMLRNYVVGRYRVKFVVDDRPQVVKRWIGRFDLKTFTVGNPWIEF